MAKLWFKNYELNELLEKFTVGNDYILDKNLLVSDCLCSIAHIQMLSSIGVLTKTEFKALKNALLEIIQLDKKGEFEIKRSDEDCHTAIEGYLTAKLGDAGKKVHTGRSRNDQVLTATRFYAKTRFWGQLLTWWIPLQPLPRNIRMSQCRVAPICRLQCRPPWDCGELPLPRKSLMT